MTIYGEYLFAENFITGIAITFVVGKICKEPLVKLRLLLAGLLAGIYGFIIFLPISSILITCSELIAAPLFMVVAFGAKSWRRTARQGILFFIITFLWGGIAIALLLAMGDESIIVGTVTYMNFPVFARLMACLAGSYGVIWIAVSIIKKQRLRGQIYGTVTISTGTSHMTFPAIIDSGNTLKDPITGTGVSILSKSAMTAVKASINCQDPRVVLIPYRTIASKHPGRFLEGLRVDYIEFQGTKYEKTIVAEAPEDFGKRSDFDVLLNCQMLERGLHEN